VFENIVLRITFGCKKKEVIRGWRGMHGDEVRDLYSSPTIIRVVKSRGMRLVGHVARIVGGELYTAFWWGNLRERDRFEDYGLDGRITLRLIFNK
jgi:hypothetical protein